MANKKDLIREEILSIKPYVPGKPIEEVKRELGLEEVIKLASNENPLGASQSAIDVMKKAAEDVHIYPDGNVYRLRKKLSEKLGVAENELTFGNGSDEIVIMLGQAFMNPDDEIIMAETTFSEYRFSANIMGGNIVQVPLKDYTHDLDAMLEAVTEQTKMIFVCNPNNPTGTMVGQEEVEEFLEEVPDDVLVIFDEAYSEYATSDDYPETIDYLDDYDNLIILRTFSKIHGLAGLRIGYGIADEEIISYIDRVRQPFNIGALAQKAAIASLEDEEHVQQSLEYNQQGKKYLYQQFEELGLDYVPTQTNFILVDIEQDNNQVFQEMLERGVIIRSMDSYGYDTKIRVTIGLPDENKRFIKELKEVIRD
ncbi:histidinol-phosphate transaminase [Halanaerobacter jeridensis]|uniref:Histidinol-phosphate aminotransferase n=1 Tax=Halanaerobacter jeridensis TaxID=706427 RepID=A0A938XS48_9FIRM|nr:histidinol-phosphate transaminase [Halanaerobacter jeridensis]MBM7556480.1 histidinol-phosphate aminotransferase [Halanaerobacter jeridensis]